jgi:hypothetical protein
VRFTGIGDSVAMQLSSYGSELLVRRQLRCGVEQVLRGAGAAWSGCCVEQVLRGAGAAWSGCCGAAGGRVLAPSRATSRAASVGAWMTTDMKADGCDGGGDFGPGTLERPAFAGVRRSKLARKRSWSSAERGVWRAVCSWLAAGTKLAQSTKLHGWRCRRPRSWGVVGGPGAAVKGYFFLEGFFFKGL